MKRILVTGGAGYVGSHTVKLLADSGFEPVVLDNLTMGHRWAVRKAPLVEGDLSDAGLILRLMNQYHIQAVVHFAASAYVGESVKKPQKYFQNNFVNTLNLLDAMLASGVQKIIFSSTCATYGVPEMLPLTESHPQRPINPYGESKLFVEKALHWYAAAYGLQWVALRYFNAAGADPSGELGECHDPETHLIPLAIQAALRTGPPIEIFGDDYATIDGTPVRDYIHVSDLAQAHVLALDYLAHGAPSKAFNLGTGRGFSAKQIIRAIEQHGGQTVPSRAAPRRDGDPPVLVADASAATQTLGWRPIHSELGSIIRTAWQWHASFSVMGTSAGSGQ